MMPASVVNWLNGMLPSDQILKTGNKLQVLLNNWPATNLAANTSQSPDIGCQRSFESKAERREE
jgi:hypothetical protein